MKSAHDSCRWVRMQLPRFIDGELAADLSERVSRHLGHCPRCSGDLVREQSSLFATVSTLVPVEPRAGLVTDIFARLDQETQVVPGRSARGAATGVPVRPASGWLTFAPAVAAAAVLSIVLWALPEDRGVTTDPSLAKVTDSPAVTDRIDPQDSGTPVAISSNDPSSTDPTPAEPADETPAKMLVKRGDVDGNDRFEWADFRAIVGYLREGETAPACLAAADFDGDGEITMHDSVMAAQELGEAPELSAGASVFAYHPGDPLPCRIECP